MDSLKLEPGLWREVNSMSLRSLTNVDVTVDSSGRSMNGNEMEYQRTQKIHDFFLLMAICNTVVVTAHAHEDLVSLCQVLSVKISSITTNVYIKGKNIL